MILITKKYQPALDFGSEFNIHVWKCFRKKQIPRINGTGKTQQKNAFQLQIKAILE